MVGGFDKLAVQKGVYVPPSSHKASSGYVRCRTGLIRYITTTTHFDAIWDEFDSHASGHKTWNDQNVRWF